MGEARERTTETVAATPRPASPKQHHEVAAEHAAAARKHATSTFTSAVAVFILLASLGCAVYAILNREFVHGLVVLVAGLYLSLRLGGVLKRKG
ncbi:MAG: hypothetical protein M5U26_07105 [Planctomycetota bacterium]|nr:hypothetical protein [Planctomycetota bacterium]